MEYFCRFLGLSQSVPVTSYIKMVDIWMLFTMTIPFLEVVYHTSNEMSKWSEADVVRVIPQSEEDEMPNNNMKVAVLRMIKRFVLPISSLLFTIIYWIVGLIASFYSGVTKDSDMSDCLMIDLNWWKDDLLFNILFCYLSVFLFNICVRFNLD